MKKIFYALSLLFICLSGFGQTNTELLKMGDAAMVNGQYTNAVYYYAFILFKEKQGEDAHYYPYEITTTYKRPEKNESGSIIPPANPNRKEVIIIHKLAQAYLMADDYKNAKTWFQSATQHPHPEYPNAKFQYGEALMYNENFNDAITVFEEFQEENGDPESKFYKMAASRIASCQFALNPVNRDMETILSQGVKGLNEGSSNFGIHYVNGNQILFSSARSDSPQDDSLNPNNKFLLDLYIATLKEDGTIDTPEKFPFIINSPALHEGSAVITADGNTLIFTRMNPENRNETKIFASKKVGGNWMQPFEMDDHINTEGFRSLSPFLSEEEGKLYFSSNRPGGHGGLDIWYVKITPDGRTGRANNLGAEVNTEGDEYTPFYHPKTQRLYYSSTGHIGFGGQDIFYNEWNPDADAYGAPINAGAPINSSADDSFFVIDEKLENGFVTSNRDACMECDSVYSLNVHCDKIYQFRRPEIVFAVRGYVYDKKTNEPIADATVEFKDVTYQWEHFEVQTDENGYYEHHLIADLELFMRADKTDYFADKALLSTIGEVASKTFEQDFYLEKIPKKEITIEGIEYDFDSANLRPESELILDELIEFLELNDDLVIEIRSHTDQRGKDDYNMNLSERRAQSVVDYLIAHDIPMDRLVPKGYGETMPAEIPDEDGEINVMTEEYIANLTTRAERKEAHQRNRRTAFFVLEQR